MYNQYNHSGPKLNYGWSTHVVEEPTIVRKQAKKIEVSIYIHHITI